MVRAILNGSKTQTRRVVKPQPEATIVGPDVMWAHGDESAHSGVGWYCCNADYPEEGSIFYRCPYGAPGDRLWVRETWGAVWPDVEPVPLKECIIEYRADLPHGCTDHPGGWPRGGEMGAPRWRPSIHMPRWASRITLEITGVRVERVQDISFADAAAEGFDLRDMDILHRVAHQAEADNWSLARSAGFTQEDIEAGESSGVLAVYWFLGLWDSINAKRGFGWDANPWVWVVEFEVIS